MRNVISLNKNWAFIQENAGLPGEMPTDWHKVDQLSKLSELCSKTIAELLLTHLFTKKEVMTALHRMLQSL